MSTHYETLNVTRGAEDVVIESAYRALMKRYHPDKTNGDPVAAERAKQINAAYSTLRDPERRARYDRSLGHAAPPFQPAPQAPQPPEPPVHHDRSEPPRPSTRGEVTSLVFIGLAILIGVGAVGSVMGNGSDTGTQSSALADGSSSTDNSSTLPAAGTSRSRSDPVAGPEREKRPRTQRDNDDSTASATGEGISSPVAEDAGNSPQTDLVQPAEPAVETTPQDLEGLF